MALQPITGYPSSWRAPFTAMELLLGQGPSSASAGPREACYCAPMTSAGTWTAGTLYPVTNEQDAVTGAGVGSMAHRMARFHLKGNPRGKLYILPYAASSGGSPVAAAGTITFVGSPTATGLVTVYVCGEQITSLFTTSSTITSIAADVRDKINQRVFLPVTATASVGVVTITAKIAGASQGDGTTGIIRFRALCDASKGLTSPPATSGAALGLGTGTAGVDGTTTELANLTAALANVTNVRLYYMGFSVWDTTSLATVKTHLVNKNAPSPGMTGRAFYADTRTLSSALTVSNNKNTELMHSVWQKNSEHDAAEIAAQGVVIHQINEELDSAFPGFDSYSGKGWMLLPAYSVTDWPSEQDKQDAVTGGLCCVTSNVVNSSLVMSVTTRSKDSTGVINDFRATETHRVSVMHDFSDTVRLQHYLTFTVKGFKLTDDPKLPDGSVDMNEVNKLGAKTMCPAKYKPWFYARLKDFTDTEKFQRLADWIAGTRVNIDPQNSSRLEVGAAGRTVDILHQTSFRIAETSPG